MRRISFIAPLAYLALCSCAGEKAAAPAREPVGQVVTHRVESGETWRSLAGDFYGDAGRAEALARDNGMDARSEPAAGSAVRIPLSEADERGVKGRLGAAREYNAGLDLAAAGNYAEASRKFEEALKLDPSLRDASFNLAVAYEKLAFHDKAVAILKQLISVEPRSAVYRYALGASLFGAAPKDSKAVFSLGVVLEKRGRREEAKSRFREYLSIDPAGAWADEARSRLDALEGPGGGGH